MSRFREYLEREGVVDDEPLQLHLPIRVDEQWLDEGLVVPRLDEEKDFMAEVEHFLVPAEGTPVTVDLGGRAEAVTSGEVIAAEAARSGTAGTVPKAVLDLVDWNAAYLAVVDHLTERGFHNLAVSPAGIRRIVEDRSTYTLVAEARLTNPATLQDMEDLQQAVIAVLRKYADRRTSVHRRRWESKHIRYLRLDKGHPNLRFNADGDAVPSYIVTAPPSRVKLIEEIQQLVETGALYDSETNEPPLIHFDRHLYQPLLIDKAPGGPPSELKTTPPQLNASETRFVEDLRAYWDDRMARNQTDGRLIFLLRNLSRGAGVGFFFEDRGFYPDFILWIKDGSTQRVVFIEPHGMMHARAYDKDDKARLHEALRELTQMLEPPPGVSSVSLDSYIVSATPYQALHPRYGDGVWTREKFAEKHILFQADRGTSDYDYIAAIFGSEAS